MVLQVTEYKVPRNSSGRADKLLAEAFPGTSRSLIKQSIDAGKTLRKNGAKLEPKTKLEPGEVLIIDLSRPEVTNLVPYETNLDIFHEDEDLIVLNKPSGMVVHPGDGTDDKTLVHALLHHCSGELCPVGAPNRPGIVHRLDKETSGVMIVAKKETSHHQLVEQFSKRKVTKIYIALVGGKMKLESGSFSGPIARHPKIRVKMAVQASGKMALTHWKLKRNFTDKASLVECDLKTGRTHQIRVHFANEGHPLLGDYTYGYNPNKYRFKKADRIMLHASEITFVHPSSGKAMYFSSPLPPCMNSFLEELK